MRCGAVTQREGCDDSAGMRFAVLLAALLLTAACTGTPSATAPPSTPPPTSPPTSSSPALKIHTWGDSVTSNGVLLKLDAPVASPKPVIAVNGKPDPARKFIVLPITVTNNAAGQATVTVWARIGQQQVDAYEDEGGASKFLPGESGQIRRPLEVPADAKGDLTLEVYANVEQQASATRDVFKGPLP